MPREGVLLAAVLAVLLDAPYFSSCCAPERRTRGLAIDLLGKRERRLIPLSCMGSRGCAWQEVSSELQVASGCWASSFSLPPSR